MVNKKAQAWSLDAMIAILIFFSGIALLFFYAINFSDQISSSLDDLSSQGEVASELILSNTDIGILIDNKVDNTKLGDFSSADYDIKRRELGVKDNFYFTIDGLAGSVGLLPPSGVKNSIKIERITVYNDKPVKFELFVWR